MYNGIQVGRFPSGTVPQVATPTCVASPTFLRGYPVVKTAGLIDECGVNPALIFGFALQDEQTNPGYSAANSPTVITGRNNTASVAVANSITEFTSPLVNGSATSIAPVAADDGAQYGLTKFSGVWYVDKAKVGANARVLVTGIDTTNNLVYFKVLSGNQQGNP